MHNRDSCDIYVAQNTSPYFFILTDLASGCKEYTNAAIALASCKAGVIGAID